jgi:hypothetical protein
MFPKSKLPIAPPPALTFEENVMLLSVNVTKEE